MRYRIKTMSKDEIFITEADYQAIVSSGVTGLVFIPSLRGTVNLNSVESILPEDIVPKKDLLEGRLHDGTMVVKRFGEWKSVFSPEATLDPHYYPEVATDAVMSEEEFQDKKKLLN